MTRPHHWTSEREIAATDTTEEPTMTTATDITAAIIADLTDAAAEWERQGGQRALVAVDLHVVSLDHDVTEEQAAAIAREAGISIRD